MAQTPSQQPQQQQGGANTPAPQQQQGSQPIYKDWASI